MDLEERFQSAQARVKTLSKTPPPGQLLQLYSYFKQANEGDVTGKRPGILDVRGRAKHDAWAGRTGMSREAAMSAYVDLVDGLVGKEK